jgi:arylsulfatase
VRHQYHHVVDIVPTILECCGVEFPQFVFGYEQTPLPGVSMAYSFDDADAPTTKHIQYYAMLGTRGIWHDGWKAVAVHGPLTSLGNFDKDEWELFHTDVDRAEAYNLADQHPEKVTQLVNMWFAEAGKYDVLPLDDRTALEILTDERPADVPASGTYVYYPGTSAIPEHTAASTIGRSFKILADVEITDPNAEGVIVSHGARFGGYTLFLKEKKLYFVYNFLGIPPEQKFISGEIQPGKYVLGMEFTKESSGQYHESHGTTRLYVNDQVVAQGAMRTQAGHFALTGEGLCIGRDSADPISSEYQSPFTFKGGTIFRVEINATGEAYMDLEVEAAAMMARE